AAGRPAFNSSQPLKGEEREIGFVCAEMIFTSTGHTTRTAFSFHLELFLSIGLPWVPASMAAEIVIPGQTHQFRRDVKRAAFVTADVQAALDEVPRLATS